MIKVDARDAIADLAGLLTRVEQGETVIIAAGDRPIAELRPVEPTRTVPRPFGLCAGEFTVPDDFDDPLPAEILDDFEGR